MIPHFLELPWRLKMKLHSCHRLKPTLNLFPPRVRFKSPSKMPKLPFFLWIRLDMCPNMIGAGPQSLKLILNPFLLRENFEYFLHKPPRCAMCPPVGHTKIHGTKWWLILHFWEKEIFFKMLHTPKHPLLLCHVSLSHWMQSHPFHSTFNLPWAQKPMRTQALPFHPIGCRGTPSTFVVRGQGPIFGFEISSQTL